MPLFYGSFHLKPYQQESLMNAQESLTLGLIGDGQLARMKIQAARRLGIEVVLYGTSRNSPAGRIVEKMIVAADYYDEKAWAEFAKLVDVATPEWENVPRVMLRALKKMGVKVSPNPDCFEISSDRLLEKQFAASLGIATAPYLSIPLSTEEDLESYFPGILKTRSGGYDGKYQIAINDVQDLEKALLKVTVPCILEKRLDFAYEISVVGVRTVGGMISLYPAVRNVHENGILRQTTFCTEGENSIPKNVRESAAQMITTILECFHYVGVLAVEMFVMPDGKILFNEIAPRVHNSGHWTIEGCSTSQFENHVRAVCDLPLGQIKPRCQKAVMLNVLGDEIMAYRRNEMVLLLRDFFHDYEKTDIKPGRKMGHLTMIS